MENLLQYKEIIIGTISVSLLAYFRGAVKGLIDLIISSFIEERILECGLGALMDRYIAKNCTMVFSTSKVYDYVNRIDKETSDKVRFACQVQSRYYSSFSLYRQGAKFFMIKNYSIAVDKDATVNTVSIFSLRGTLDLNFLLEEVVRSSSNPSYNFEDIMKNPGYALSVHRLYCSGQSFDNVSISELPSSNVIRFIGDTSGTADSALIKGVSPFEGFYMNEAFREGISELEFWLSKRSWFISRGIPYNTSWCLYGDPGTGKSSSVAAVASRYNLPILSIDLGTFDDHTLIEQVVPQFKSKNSGSPFIVLVEDIDSVFDGRKSNIKGLTFSTFINLIQGVESPDGMFLVITTNHIEKLDHALGGPNVNGKVKEMPTGSISNRPGRINRLIKMDNPDEKGRTEIASRILVDYPEEVSKIVEENPDVSGAKFKYICQLKAVELINLERGKNEASMEM